MLTFEKIEIRNFMSIGDVPITIELNRSPTTALIAKNGAGKCVSLNTPIRVLNKKTGEIMEMSIGKLYEKTEQDNRGKNQ